MLKLQGKYKSVKVVKQDGAQLPDDEPMFVLRSQDMLAPIAVRFYADLVQGATGNTDQAEQIRAFAEAMSRWSPRKLPD